MTPSFLCIFFVLRFSSGDSTDRSTDDNAAVQYKFIDSNYDLKDEKDMTIPGNKSLIVLVHGYRSGTQSAMISDLGKSFARSTDSANVALVDWSDWTQKLDYVTAVHQLPTVAGYLVNWLNGLRDHRGIVESFDDVTMVGHSLGAQLIGYAGHRLNGTVNRIIALDPAQPNFKTGQKNERVDVNSGRFVMVLHTSTIFLGLREPVGHADFYFNDGQTQPSCNNDTVCGHVVVVSYMMDSLQNSSAFPAHRCLTLDDCEKKVVDLNEPTINMNVNTPNSTRGLYSIIPEKKKLKIYSRFFAQ